MKGIFISLILLTVTLAGCSLAGDVTPPPAMATAQAAPIQPGAIRPTAVIPDQEPAGFIPPQTKPNLPNGAAIFTESCAPCHGPAGMGDGSMSANLDVPIPALGDFNLAGGVRPMDWYAIVTEGRMENFMPPFTSLSGTQRWDVVAYALSLSYPTETREAGADLYAEFCAACHGESGEGADLGPALNTGEGFAVRSLIGMIDLMEAGVGDMPAFEGALTDEELVLLTAYVQGLGTVVHGTAGEDLLADDTSGSAAVTGSIRGVVNNGTEGAAIPGDLQVTIVALDGGVPVFEQDRPVGADGGFTVDDLEIAPGRIFGALVEYQDVVYFSVGGHLLEEAPLIELPVTIYEATVDQSGLIIDRLHLIFDFSVEGVVEISELLLLSTDGDRTVVQGGGQNAIPVSLPDGFSNLRFDTAMAEQYSVTETGFVVHEPVRPGEPLEVVFSFTLPYERSLDFKQPLDLPVQAVVVLTESEAPEIQGQGVQDQGASDMGGMLLRNYTLAAMQAGDELELTLRGAHPLSGPDMTTSNLAIGLGVFGIVLVGVGLVLWTLQRRSTGEQSGPRVSDGTARSREDLLLAIAQLDEAYEAGEVDQESYEQERAALKAQIMEHMPKT